MSLHNRQSPASRAALRAGEKRRQGGKPDSAALQGLRLSECLKFAALHSREGNKLLRRVTFAALAGFLACLAVSGWGAVAQEASLLDGPGSEVAKESCLSCHSATPITQQRLTRTQWQNEVEKMIRWGAEVPADSKDKLVDYFAAHFPSRKLVSPKGPGSLPEGAGLDAVKESCLSCHGGEPITQQRLSRAQWTAEVDKMIRWGADVPADKKDSMITYLAEHFGNMQ